MKIYDYVYPREEAIYNIYCIDKAANKHRYASATGHYTYKELIDSPMDLSENDFKKLDVELSINIRWRNIEWLITKNKKV